MVKVYISRHEVEASTQLTVTGIGNFVKHIISLCDYAKLFEIKNFA